MNHKAKSSLVIDLRSILRFFRQYRWSRPGPQTCLSTNGPCAFSTHRTVKSNWLPWFQ